MSKKVKHVIALTLTVFALSAIEPVNYFNLTTMQAYAASSNDDIYLKSIHLSEGSINFSKSTSTYNLKVSNLVDEIDITAKPDCDSEDYEDYTVEIDGNNVEDINSFKSTVKLYKGKNVIKVKVSDDEDNKKTYTLNITRGLSSDNEDNQDEIYLSEISLSNGSINFSKNTDSYNAVVDESVEKLTIKAKPEDEDYTVEINDEKVYSYDSYKKTVNLEKGKNTFTIIVDDNDSQRTYTLNVYRGTIYGIDEDETFSGYSNQWINVNGRLKYSDLLGRILKNTWFYDTNVQKTYYLGEDGYRKTGWFRDNGYWYYLGNDGAKQTGWKSIDGSWYYLNMSGVMKTGWFKDKNEKWYYLEPSGAMAIDTTINGYDVGHDGAWIVK